MNKPPDYNRLREILTEIEAGPMADKKADVLDPFRAMMGEMMSAITQSKDIETARNMRGRMVSAIAELEDHFPALS